jgi:hypothetical protein
VNLFQEITNLPVKIQFVGFEIEDKKQKLELNSKRLATTDSVNDLLGEQDKEREEYMVGGVNIYDIKGISNPQIFQSVLFSLQQKALQAQQMQQPAQTNNIMEQAKDGGQENHGKEQEIDQKQQEEEPKANNGELTDKDRELLNKYKDIAVMDEDLQNEYYGEN